MPGPDPRDGAQVIAELAALLEATDEAPPYVLVGHSLGRIHMRMLAATRPQDVAGLVLIDTAYPLAPSPELEQQICTSLGFYQMMGALTASGLLRILPESGHRVHIDAPEAVIQAVNEVIVLTR